MPEERTRAAKARVVEHDAKGNDLRRRAVVPLVGEAGPAVNVTNADIEAAFAAEDADRYRRP